MCQTISYSDTNVRFVHAETPCVNPLHFERHCHSEYELLFVLRGSGSFVVEGVKYPLVSGSLMVFRPNEYHYVCPDSGTEYERVVINFLPALLTETASAEFFFGHSNRSAGNGLYFAGETLSPSVISGLEIAIREAENAGNGERLTAILSCTLSQILLILSREIPADLPQTDTGTAIKIIHYLNEHLTESFTLKDLAKEFLISDSYLCRIFHQVNGLSIREYVNEKRISLAKQLLRQGLSATEVAFQTGFSDYSTFFRTFKKITGTSPTRVQ